MKLEIKKIPLDMFLDALTEVYNNGADYIGLIVEKIDNQDHIWIVTEMGETIITKDVDENVDFESLG